MLITCELDRANPGAYISPALKEEYGVVWTLASNSHRHAIVGPERANYLEKHPWRAEPESRASNWNPRLLKNIRKMPQAGPGHYAASQYDSEDRVYGGLGAPMSTAYGEGHEEAVIANLREKELEARIAAQLEKKYKEMRLQRLLQRPSSATTVRPSNPITHWFSLEM